MKRPSIITIILLLLGTGMFITSIAAKKEAARQQDCTPQCGCLAREGVQDKDAGKADLLNKAQNSIVRMTEFY